MAWESGFRAVGKASGVRLNLGAVLMLRSEPNPQTEKVPGLKQISTRDVAGTLLARLILLLMLNIRGRGFGP